MPVLHKSATIDAQPETAYRIVADVPRYPEFLPDIVRAELRDDIIELEIRLGLMTVPVVNRAIFDPPRSITFDHVRGPFRHFRGQWTFEPTEAGTRITYHLDFEPKLAIPGASRIMIAALDRNTEQTIEAFRERIERAEQ